MAGASRSTKVLDEWRVVAAQATMPAEGPRQVHRQLVSPLAPLVAIVVFVGVLVATRLDGGPAAPVATATFPEIASSTIAPSSPAMSPSPSPAPSATGRPMPSVGGTCSRDQILLGESVSGPGYGAAGTTIVFLTQELKNTGPRCEIAIASWLRVLGQSSTPEEVPATNTASTESREVASGGSVTIILSATWGAPPSPPADCAKAVSGVTTVFVPLSDGEIQIDTGVTWRFVCQSAPSVDVSFKN